MAAKLLSCLTEKKNRNIGNKHLDLQLDEQECTSTKGDFNHQIYDQKKKKKTDKQIIIFKTEKEKQKLENFIFTYFCKMLTQKQNYDDDDDEN